MKNIDIRKILGLLGSVLRCPVCQQVCNLDNLKIMEEASIAESLLAGRRMVIHMECERCQGCAILSIGWAEGGLLEDELTSSEEKRLADLPPLQTDHALDIYQWISTTPDPISLLRANSDKKLRLAKN